MAAANYDEVTHSAGAINHDCNRIDPLYKWDTHFPERFSRLCVTPDFSGGGAGQRRQKRGRARNAGRFKTQPITFDEIKEVDEEPGTTEDRKEGLKNQFAAFSRSMDGLVPGFPVLPPCLRKGAKKYSPELPHPGCAASAHTEGRDVGTAPAAPSSEQEVQNKKENDDAAVFTAAGLNPALAHVQDISRARRKKRRSRRSIEEEPELEKLATADSQEAG